jgi:hypothetical protein
MAEVKLRDENDMLTRDGMLVTIKSGGSVYWAGRMITREDQIPDASEMDEVHKRLKEAASAGIERQIKELMLTREYLMSSTGRPTQPTTYLAQNSPPGHGVVETPETHEAILAEQGDANQSMSPPPTPVASPAYKGLQDQNPPPAASVPAPPQARPVARKTPNEEDEAGTAGTGTDAPAATGGTTQPTGQRSGAPRPPGR